jgi:hypothetical protein
MRGRACFVACVVLAAAACSGATIPASNERDAAVDASAIPDDGGSDAIVAEVDAREQRDAAAVPDAGVETSIDSGRDARDAAVVDAADAADAVDAADSSSPGSLWACPALPAFDDLTIAHVRAVRSADAAATKRASVFAKAGDSITGARAFLVEAKGTVTYGNYGALSPAVSFFKQTDLGGGDTSFDRASSAAEGGWTTVNALGPPNRVAAEIDQIQPAYVIVMFGTNDLETYSVSQFSTNLGAIVDTAEQRGTVAIVSTIPDRTSFQGAGALVRTFNDAIRSLASSRHLPLIDLFVALASLPGSGLSSDGVHPNVAPTGSCDFSQAGLQYGYNVRNLTAIQMLDRLRSL